MTEDDEMLNRLNAVRNAPPSLPSGLMARVLADATAAQLALKPHSNVVAMVRPRLILNWMASAALAASALFGVALGYSGPDILSGFSSIADLVAGSSTNLPNGIDELGALNVFLAEG